MKRKVPNPGFELTNSIYAKRSSFQFLFKRNYAIFISSK